MVTFYLVRHGETDANRNGVAQGHLDVPLSEVGLEQAEIAGEALKDVKFDAIYASDLKRAFQTAQAIMRYQKCPLVSDRRLREMNMGLLQGVSHKDFPVRFPEFMQAFSTDSYNTRRPGGESVADLDERAQRAMDDIYAWSKRRNGGAVVGIVSHGGTIRSILRLAGPDPELIAPGVGNCSVSIMRCDGGKWTIVSIGDCTHLPSPGDV